MSDWSAKTSKRIRRPSFLLTTALASFVYYRAVVEFSGKFIVIFFITLMVAYQLMPDGLSLDADRARSMFDRWDKHLLLPFRLVRHRLRSYRLTDQGSARARR